MFSTKNHNVLEAFAGSCRSVKGAVRLGRNLFLVEKHTNFQPMFAEAFRASSKRSKEICDESVQSGPSDTQKLTGIIDETDQDGPLGTQTRPVKITKLVQQKSKIVESNLDLLDALISSEEDKAEPSRIQIKESKNSEKISFDLEQEQESARPPKRKHNLTVNNPPGKPKGLLSLLKDSRKKV
jgi:hypothetical protein